jgi:hypothetical protein
LLVSERSVGTVIHRLRLPDRSAQTGNHCQWLEPWHTKRYRYLAPIKAQEGMELIKDNEKIFCGSKADQFQYKVDKAAQCPKLRRENADGLPKINRSLR